MDGPCQNLCFTIQCRHYFKNMVLHFTLKVTYDKLSQLRGILLFNEWNRLAKELSTILVRLLLLVINFVWRDVNMWLKYSMVIICLKKVCALAEIWTLVLSVRWYNWRLRLLGYLAEFEVKWLGCVMQPKITLFIFRSSAVP